MMSCLQLLMNSVMRKIYFVWFFFLIGSIATAHGQQHFDNKHAAQVIDKVSVFEDKTGDMSFESIQKPAIQNQFKFIDLKGEELNIGFSHSTYWIKIPLSTHKSEYENLVLEIPYFGLDYINLYEPNGQIINTGGMLSIESRPIPYRYYAFPITLTSEVQNFYLEVKSHQTISIPLKLWDRASFDRHVQQDTLIQALYYGGLGVLAIFNLFIFAYLRENSHLFYALFAFFTGLGVFAGNGMARLYLWSEWPRWDLSSQAVFLSISAAMGLLFTAEFLKIHLNFPKLNKLLRYFAWLFLIYAVLLTVVTALNISSKLVFEILPVLAILAILLVLFSGSLTCKLKQQSAYFFILAWGILCAGGFIACLRLFNFIPSNWFTSYALQISSAFEMVLLSFALASRIQFERNLRETAQLESLKSKETLVESLRASEDRLERQVLMRTNELRSMLENEKKLREQYVRFGSLISHEFRSPLGIIETQASLLNRQVVGHEQGRRLAVIRSAAHRLALLFDRWLHGDRLENKIDIDRPQLIQLNDWLIEVTERCKSYHHNHVLIFTPNENDPLLTVDEKLLEIVVLNLIDNACKYSANQTIVRIGIKLNAGKIGLSVSDQGIGIAPSDHEKIFEEFFQISSKPNRRGYGLGLSFVRKVMHHFGGTIEVISEKDAGAEFIAWFPQKTITDFISIS